MEGPPKQIGVRWFVRAMLQPRIIITGIVVLWLLACLFVRARSPAAGWLLRFFFALVFGIIVGVPLFERWRRSRATRDRDVTR
jgi:uncharacterized membrane protein SirB2